MIVSLVPGTYTATIGPSCGGTCVGAGLIEVYDLTPDSGGQLANISTRTFIAPGGVMLGGFIVGFQNTRILARAMSVSASFPPIGDPTLELHDSNGGIVAFNDNWKDTQRFEIEATTIPPTTDLESAIVQTLAPGAYTAIVRGVNDKTSGGALVEIYTLP